jgi:hypothetical protein
MKKITLLFAFMALTVVTVGQNNSLHFDGVDDYVELGQNFAFTPTDAFTIEAWIKIDAIGLKQIISKLGIEQNTFRGWGFQINAAGNLSGYVSSEWDVHSRFVRGVTVFGDDLWHHVAMTFDGADTILLYIDGLEEPIGFENTVGSLTSIATTSNTHIGNYDGNGNPGEYFDGNMDELRIWDTERTPAEILNNYNTELGGAEANLIGYYKMDVPNSTCDVEDCNSNEAHGERNGPNGSNDLVQFSEDVPVIANVACGVTSDCQLLGNADHTNLLFSVYPSPATDYVSFGGIDLNGSEVQIFNSLGSRVSTQQVENNSVDVRILTTGLYYLSFEWDNKAIIRKIVKK